MYFEHGAWHVTVIDALTPLPLVAVIFAEPFIVAPAAQVTRPADDTVAALESELHWTVVVTSLVAPSM